MYIEATRGKKSLVFSHLPSNAILEVHLLVSCSYLSLKNIFPFIYILLSLYLLHILGNCLCCKLIMTDQHNLKSGNKTVNNAVTGLCAAFLRVCTEKRMIVS